MDMNQFRRQIKLIQKLKSPHIVNLNSLFFKDDNFWLVMEYCSAGSVLDIINCKLVDNIKYKYNSNKNDNDDDDDNNYNCKDYYRFTEDEICIIMRETLKGLSYLHSKNIVHREIQGKNILLNKKGQCKLINYNSLSAAIQEMRDLALATSRIGSPYWTAPEIFKGTPWHIKADIWSLGITAIEMACGQPPHSDKPSPLQCMFLIPKAPAPRLPEKRKFQHDHDASGYHMHHDHDWSDEFRDWVSKACDKDIKRRFNADELLKHKWFTRKGLSLNITLKLVENVQPLIDARRERAAKKELEYDDDYDDDYDYDYDYDCVDQDDNSNKKENPKKHILQFESVFKGNEYIDKCMEIPKDASKKELIEIWNAVRDTSRKDKKIFEEFYKSILDQLDDMLVNHQLY